MGGCNIRWAKIIHLIKKKNIRYRAWKVKNRIGLSITIPHSEFMNECDIPFVDAWKTKTWPSRSPFERNGFHLPKEWDECMSSMKPLPKFKYSYVPVRCLENYNFRTPQEQEKREKKEKKTTGISEKLEKDQTVLFEFFKNERLPHEEWGFILYWGIRKLSD